jgi:hypothetical protein
MKMLRFVQKLLQRTRIRLEFMLHNMLRSNFAAILQNLLGCKGVSEPVSRTAVRLSALRRLTKEANLQPDRGENGRGQR